MKTYNKYSPFPIYDTDDLKSFEDKIENDDSEQVEFCSGCKSLFVFNDEFHNTWCGKCNSLNSTDKLPDIETYLKEHGHIWGLTSTDKDE